MLIKRCSSPTNFVLPVTYCKNGNCYKINWYYESETVLFKAYNQLKRINGLYKPLYPIVYESEEDIYV